MARKKKTWTSADVLKFKELCGCFATRDEVCATFGISPKTLNKLINEKLHDELAPDSDEPVTFQDAFKAYSAAARGSLRRKQFELAMHGDKTMLIFLGKNYLAQTDREPEHRQEAQQQGPQETAYELINKRLPERFRETTTPPDIADK